MRTTPASAYAHGVLVAMITMGGIVFAQHVSPSLVAYALAITVMWAIAVGVHYYGKDGAR